MKNWHQHKRREDEKNEQIRIEKKEKKEHYRNACIWTFYVYVVLWPSVSVNRALMKTRAVKRPFLNKG